MANNISTRQWYLDTPLPFGSPGSILWKSNIAVLQIEFSGYSAATDTCVLKDRNGRTVWSATGATDMEPIRLGNIGWVNGLCLDTLGSGLCIVYIR